MKMNRENFLDSFKSRSFKSGGYSVLMSLFVIAIIVAVNLIFAELPDSVTKPDLSSMQLYNFTDETINMAKNVDEKIKIYLWAEKGTEDEQIVEFLSRYSDLNSNISVEYIDPAYNPNFISKYTDSEIAQNSLVIESAKRSKVVEVGEIYTYNYTEEEFYNYYYTYYAYPPANQFSAENAVVSAVDYVTSEVIPVAYMLTKHGETAFSDTLKGYVSDANIELSNLDLMSLDAVPEDAACVVINNPSEDLSADELEKLLSYMSGGGRILLFTNYSFTNGENFMALCEAYGLRAVEGMVFETSNNAAVYVYNLIAQCSSHEITNSIINENYSVLMPLAHGIEKIDSYRSSLTIFSLLSTSDGAYSKTGDLSQLTTYDKEDGDIGGPFILGAAVTETVGDKQSEFVWYSSGYMLNDGINISTASYMFSVNSNLLINTLSWMAEKEQGISIRALSLETETLIMSSGASTFWFVILTFITPISLLGFGFAVWYKRRKR